MAKKRKKKKKNRYEGKGGERFLRLLILVGAGFLILTLARGLARRSTSLPLPKFNLPKLSDQDGSAKEVLNQVLSEVDLGEKVEGEPIAEPVQEVQSQTQSLIDSIKQLPQDQLEAVKEQLYKEICQDYCRQTTAEKTDDITELPPED